MNTKSHQYLLKTITMSKKTILFLSLTTMILVSCKNETKDLSLTTKEDSLSYAIGVSIGSNITKDFESQGLDTVIDVSKLMHAMKASLDTGEVEMQMNEEDANKFLQSYFADLQTKQQGEQKKKFETENQDNLLLWTQT